MVKLKLTEEEKQAITTELAERMKDVIYMNAKEKAEETLNNILQSDLSPVDIIKVTYQIQILFNDILQMLGRIRREKENNPI